MAELVKKFVQYEPKKENRFVITFPKPFEIPEYVIHKCSRPVYNQGKWSDIMFSMHDAIEPSTTRALVDGIRELRKMDDPILIIDISLLDPVGQTIEKWLVKGTIETINFGTLDYSSDKLLEINVHFKVNTAILEF